MSMFIDKKYINLVSGQLEHFKWKSGELANCRCPICGDSQKNKTKCRGYFYKKGNSFFYRCHNCGYGSSVKNFLDKVSPSLMNEYKVEMFEETFGKKKRKKEVTMNFVPFKPRQKGIVKAEKVSSLPVEHPCAAFVESRKIPEEWVQKLLYTDDFGSFVSLLIDNETNFPKEERLIIPFTNENGDIYAAQGRRLSDADTPKYYTAKSKSDDKLWFNLHDIDTDEPVIIVEGPIDAMFLPNAIAMVGSGSVTNLPDELNSAEVIYALDNEPRNKQIVSYYENLIEKGAKVCIWPSNVREKDVNEMVLNGVSDINDLILSNSHSGLEASLKFTNWRKL